MKNVLITGASGGIGEAVARAFAQKKIYRICLHANKNPDSVRALAEEFKQNGVDAECFIADLRSLNEIEKMFSEISAFCGGVDVLVNNAGTSLIKPFNDTSDAEWDEIFAVNVKAQFLCAKLGSRQMIAKKRGRIINIGSMWGSAGASCEVAYSASKAAVNGFTKALSKELAISGITVNCVEPGFIDTKMNGSLSEETRRELIKQTPVGRIGTPEDVARAVLFFADDAADFITGQVLTVDGGFAI